MTIKELKNKRSSLVSEMTSISDKIKAEKRALSADEQAKVKDISAQLDSIKSELEALAAIEAVEAEEAQRSFNPQTAPKADKGFESFVKEMRNGKFALPMEEFEQRATVTTTSNSHFKFTDMKEGSSVNEPDLVLESLGSKVAYFGEGNVAYPSFSHISATFGTEDNSVSDATLTSAQKVLSPNFVSASLEVSKAFITQSKKKNIEDLKNALVYAVKKAVEKRALTSCTGGTGTITGTTSYARAVHAESVLVGTGTGIVAGTNAVKRMKQEKIDAGSGIMTWTKDEVNGYAAKRSVLAPTVNHVFYGDFSSVVQAYFGNEITIELVTDATLSRKGNVLIIASAMADAALVDANKMTSFLAV